MTPGRHLMRSPDGSASPVQPRRCNSRKARSATRSENWKGPRVPALRAGEYSVDADRTGAAALACLAIRDRPDRPRDRRSLRCGIGQRNHCDAHLFLVLQALAPPDAVLRGPFWHRPPDRTDQFHRDSGFDQRGFRHPLGGGGPASTKSFCFLVRRRRLQVLASPPG